MFNAASGQLAYKEEDTREHITIGRSKMSWNTIKRASAAIALLTATIMGGSAIASPQVVVPLNGDFTIQQKSNGRFVDAHEGPTIIRWLPATSNQTPRRFGHSSLWATTHIPFSKRAMDGLWMPMKAQMTIRLLHGISKTTQRSNGVWCLKARTPIRCNK